MTHKFTLKLLHPFEARATSQVRRGFLLLIVVLTGACAKKDKSDLLGTDKLKTNAIGLVYAEQNQAFLSSSRFTTSNPFIPDQSEVTSLVNNLNSLWHSVSVDTSSISTASSTSGECDHESKIHMLGTSRFYVGAYLDLTQCPETLAAKDYGQIFNKYTIRYYNEFSCSGVNLSAFDGMTLTPSVASQIDSACQGASRGFLMNRTIEIDLTVTSQAGEASVSMIDDYSRSSESGTACTETPQQYWWEVSNGCMERFKTHYSGTGDTSIDGKDDLILLKAKDLTMTNNASDPFYSSGQKEIFMMGWSGAITYNIATQNPGWSLTRNGTTVTGTLPNQPTSSSSSVSFSGKATSLDEAPSIKKSLGLMLADQWIAQRSIQ